MRGSVVVGAIVVAWVGIWRLGDVVMESLRGQDALTASATLSRKRPLSFRGRPQGGPGTAIPTAGNVTRTTPYTWYVTDSTTLRDRTQLVAQLARDAGFALVGVAPADPSAHGDFVEHWLSTGQHGEMDYLANHVEQRLDPRVLLPGAKCVICVADRYHVGYPESTGGSDPGLRKGPACGDGGDPDVTGRDNPRGRIARYAWGDDYHKVMKKRLHGVCDALHDVWPDEQYKTCVDSAPILEREHAARAGLGWVGKHTLLIHPQLGSWLLLGEIVTTLELETAEQTAEHEDAPIPGADHCGTCTRCIDACPTDCITPYQLNASRCISYLTIEHRGEIDPSLHEPMGDWIAGCDVCQEVCPHQPDGGNTGRKPRAASDPPHESSFPGDIYPRYTPRPPAPSIPLLDLLGWGTAARQAAFTGSALKRIKLDMLKRNALIAAGNALRDRDDPALRARVEALADYADESELVRVTAKQVLAALADAEPET